MMDRADMLRIIDGAYEARVSGDRAALAAYLAPGATFRLAGQPSLIPAFPVDADDAQKSIGTIIDLVQFHDYERQDAVIEGDSAAVRWRATLSIGGKPPVTTELFDLWTFGGDGKATSLTQFADTALLQSLLD